MSEDPTRDPHDIPPLPRPWGAPKDASEAPTSASASLERPLQETEDAESMAPLPNDAPFPPAAPIGPKPAAAGCAKPAAIGCGCLGLLFAGLLVAGIVLSPRLITWFLDTSETTILNALPPDVTEQQADTLRSGFRAYREGFKDNSLGSRGLLALNNQIAAAMQRAQTGALDAADVSRLIDAFLDVFPDLGSIQGEPGPPAPDLDQGSRSLPVAATVQVL